jgi:hypothetical protein
MKYFSEAREIWHSFVPKAGQADTVQGELLRAVEKLRDEARRNGNLNWDRGFFLFVEYLSLHLRDSEVFSSEIVERSTRILERLSEFRDPYLEDDLYDELGDRVVEWYQHCGSKAHTNNPDLQR